MRRSRDSRGAAAVEFAIIAPILITLLLGVMEFGYQFVLAGATASAAREGARAAAVSDSQANGAAAATNRMSTVPLTGTLGVTVVKLGSGDACVWRATVRVNGSGLTGFFDSLVPGGLNVQSQGEMRCGG
ncbi:TadE family protein [Aestuariimicrobium soli]|uniref:TadE family protein n=1 Tax=Aestuariimicrobium soli TaxID=2035834 RepID=UPI003EBB00AA